VLTAQTYQNCPQSDPSNAPTNQVSANQGSYQNAYQAATLVTVTQPLSQPPSNMAGTPMCLASYSKPNLSHFVFSSQHIDKFAISHTDWVIDTGATDHMVINTQFLTSMQVVHNVSVNLPNGQSVTVTHIGSVQLSSTLLFTDVLCVPSFDFNLISVSKLTFSLHCCIFFLSNYYFMQDLLYWRMIGMGKQHNGLYLLDISSTSNHVAAITSSVSSFHNLLYSLSLVKHTNNDLHVWHCRLGHPSFSKMSFLSSVLPNFSHSHNNTDVCIVCPLAKQKRLTFPHNNNLSPCAFDLLHIDI
jgi:hypothetical protein